MASAGLLGSCAASAGSSAGTPVPPWAQNLDAQREARTIESAWRDGSELERAATQPLLVRFLAQYPGDPRADTVRLRLAWLDIGEQQYDAAGRRIDQVLLHASGVDADMANVLREAIRAERGQPALALYHLQAQGGRLVDAETRELWATVAVKVAFLAHAFDEAVSLMLVWREIVSEEHQARTEREIESCLWRLDEAVLVRSLDRLTLAGAQPSAEESRHRAKIWMLEAVRARLGSLAISANNGKLARRVIKDAPPRFIRSPDGEKLRRLAQALELPVGVMHAAIGLMLELDDDRASRQSAELVTGAMRALASVEENEPVRLVTRELRAFDASEAERALSSLVADGAALLIAGLSSKTASLAVQVAEENQIAVVLLAEPAESLRRSPFAFVVESPSAEARRIFHAATAESHRVAELTNADTFCHAEGRLGWTPSFLTSRGDLFVAADAACAQRLAVELQSRQDNPKVWLGPYAAAAADAFDEVTVITGAQFLVQSPASPAMRWRERFQRLPSWDEALGYDVARLGIEAIRRRGFDSLRGDALVRDARRKIRDDLRRVESDLMTSSARGFAGRASLAPTLVAHSSHGASKAGAIN
jgi:hypothetical protein